MSKSGNRVERDRLEMIGIVIDSCKDIFEVKISDNYTVTAKVAGKIRQNSIKIVNGDKVTVDISTMDTTKGRIVYRHK